MGKLHNLDICENFLRFYEISNIKSATVVTAIKDAFVRFQLSFSSLRGQTYDGASNMMWVKSGVATQIKAIQPNSLETHCHAHSVSLVVKETTRRSKVLRDSMTACLHCLMSGFRRESYQLMWSHELLVAWQNEKIRFLFWYFSWKTLYGLSANLRISLSPSHADDIFFQLASFSQPHQCKSVPGCLSSCWIDFIWQNLRGFSIEILEMLDTSKVNSIYHYYYTI